MKLLLDTHILLWARADDEKLPMAARALILDESNEIMFSVAAAWEVAIKHSLKPDQMLVGAKELLGFCDAAGYEALPVQARHVVALEELRRAPDARPHNDPFDRIMIAQAKADGMMLLTHDTLIPDYQEPCILRV